MSDITTTTPIEVLRKIYSEQLHDASGNANEQTEVMRNLGMVVRAAFEQTSDARADQPARVTGRGHASDDFGDVMRSVGATFAVLEVLGVDTSRLGDTMKIGAH